MKTQTVVVVLVTFFTAMLCTSWNALNLRDDRFRNHCVDVKRVYQDGSCLGMAEQKDLRPTPKKLGGERTWNDLAAACKEAGGWLESSSGNNLPVCGGIDKDPPAPGVP